MWPSMPDNALTVAGVEQSPSRLLSTLPREIRDKIYDYVLRIDTDKHFKDGAIIRVNHQLHSETTERLLETYSFVYVSFSVLKTIVDRHDGLAAKPASHGEGFYIQHSARGCVTAFKRYSMRINISAPGLSRRHTVGKTKDDRMIHVMVIGNRNLVRICRRVGDSVPYVRRKLRSTLVFEITLHQQRKSESFDRQLERHLLGTLSRYWWGVPKVNINGAHDTELAKETTLALVGRRWSTPHELFHELQSIFDDNTKPLPLELCLQDITAKVLLQWHLWVQALRHNQAMLTAHPQAFKPLQDRFWYDYGSLSGHVYLLQALCAASHHNMQGWAVRAVDSFASARDRHTDSTTTASTTENETRLVRCETAASMLIGHIVPNRGQAQEEVLAQLPSVEYLHNLYTCSRWMLSTVELTPAEGMRMLQDLTFNVMKEDFRHVFAEVGGGHLLELLTVDTTRERFAARVVSTSRTCVCCNQLE